MSSICIRRGDELPFPCTVTSNVNMNCAPHERAAARYGFSQRHTCEWCMRPDPRLLRWTSCGCIYKWTAGGGGRCGIKADLLWKILQGYHADTPCVWVMRRFFSFFFLSERRIYWRFLLRLQPAAGCQFPPLEVDFFFFSRFKQTSREMLTDEVMFFNSHSQTSSSHPHPPPPHPLPEFSTCAQRSSRVKNSNQLGTWKQWKMWINNQISQTNNRKETTQKGSGEHEKVTG